MQDAKANTKQEEQKHFLSSTWNFVLKENSGVSVGIFCEAT